MCKGPEAGHSENWKSLVLGARWEDEGGTRGGGGHAVSLLVGTLAWEQWGATAALSRGEM